MTLQAARISGSFVYPVANGGRPASAVDEMIAAIQNLERKKQEWAEKTIGQRLRFLETMIRDFASLAPEWVKQVSAAQHIAENDHALGTEWMQGPYCVLRNLQNLMQSLREIRSANYPRIPGAITLCRDGQVSAQVFPQTMYDRILFNGYRAEVWMEEGVTLENLRQTQALAYRSADPVGKVTLVLGAGNISGIPVTDVLDRLFIQNHVVILKMNPVMDYLGSVFERGFRCLIEAGYLQIVYGGADEGAYLCQHPGIDDIFVTGSDKTFDAIVFGPGQEGALRKSKRQRLIEKPVTGELGDVTPAIIVPGTWRQDDLGYQAENLVSWLTDNVSSACNTPRVVVLHAEWPHRSAFLDALRRAYAQTPLRCSFYPGSQQRYQAFLRAHPNAEQIGSPGEGELPWTIIPDVSSENRDDICFTTESFCCIAAVTLIAAASVPQYLERAVTFANETLWGTLAAGLFIHPDSMKDPQTKSAVETAIEKLRFGTIGVNCAAGLSWVLMTTPWGAYPGSDVYDIQSGNSFVHNTLMFSKPQKTVLYARFREKPKPIAFVSRGKTMRAIAPLLVDLMAKPSILKLPRILQLALR